MHQAAARYWNEIAATQPLKTEWAQQMFPLPQEQLNAALDREEQRLTRETNDPQLASVYLKIMPLLWENEAISKFLNANPSLTIAMPPLQSLSEALMVAAKDSSLTNAQMAKLKKLLSVQPT